MKKAYILSTSKSLINEFFETGIWSHEDMTSVVFEKNDGKLIQVFGSGKAGSYDYFRNEIVELVSDTTRRTFGFGKMVCYSDGFVKGARTYVFK